MLVETGEMSAEISSTETKAENREADAADFLLSNSKYHDCFLTVGNPDTDEVEDIGASSLHLIAHSPVLREMLEHRAGDIPDSRIHVMDVPPATFKLMLRYVFGGRIPQMTAVEAAGLALCADKFRIPRLVQKALKRLDPTNAEDVFPSLICVTYTNFPELELKVTKIIQQETNRIVKTPDFMELEENCVVFILKQNTLNIDELELWKSVVCWAEKQVKKSHNRTVRDCLVKIVGYVRFLSFTVEEILEHVLPTKGLTPEECFDLILAVTRKRPLESPVLCKIRERRHLFNGENVSSATGKTENKTTDKVNLLQDLKPTVSKLGVLKKPGYIFWNIVSSNFILFLIFTLNILLLIYLLLFVLL